MTAPRRPRHLLAAAGLAGHHTFELAAGVGILGQRELGLPGAVAAWSGLVSAFAALSWKGSRRWDRVLAAAVGANLTAALAHFTLWPWRLCWGLPVLRAAEGLPRSYLPAYNLVLLAWEAAIVAAAGTEVPAGARRWLLAGAVAAIPLRQHAKRHAAWLEQQSRVRPAWWNRAPHPPRAT